MNGGRDREPIEAKKAAREAIVRALARPDFTFREAKILLGLVVLMMFFDRDGDDVSMRQLTGLLTNVSSDAVDGRDRRWVTATTATMPEVEYRPAPRGRGARAHVRFIPDEEKAAVGASFSVVQPEVQKAAVDAAISDTEKAAANGRKRPRPRAEKAALSASPRGVSEERPRKPLASRTRARGRAPSSSASGPPPTPRADSQDDDLIEADRHDLIERFMDLYQPKRREDRETIERFMAKLKTARGVDAATFAANWCENHDGPANGFNAKTVRALMDIQMGNVTAAEPHYTHNRDDAPESVTADEETQPEGERP